MLMILMIAVIAPIGSLALGAMLALVCEFISAMGAVIMGLVRAPRRIYRWYLRELA